MVQVRVEAFRNHGLVREKIFDTDSHVEALELFRKTFSELADCICIATTVRDGLDDWRIDR